MEFLKEHLSSLVWTLVGIAIVVSPEGRVLQMQISFGEYKYLVGGFFVVVGLCMSLFQIRKKSEGQRRHR